MHKYPYIILFFCSIFGRNPLNIILKNYYNNIEMRYLLLLFVITITSCSAQSKDCSKFKTGTFKYSDNNDWVITRTDSVQIEVNNKDHVKYIGIINWVSDCKYTLTYKNVNNPDYKSIIGTKFSVDIVYIDEEMYRYIAYDSIRKIKGSLIKVE